MPERAPSQILAAGIAGGLIGAIGGYALGSSFNGSGGAIGALVGAAVVGSSEAITDAKRVPGRVKPLWQRILSGAALAAGFGWLLGLVVTDTGVFPYAAGFGLFLGALGFRWRKAVLGLVVGAVVGLVIDSLWPAGGLPWAFALALVTYRTIAAGLFRGQEQMSIAGENIPAADLEFVVPFASRNRYVGIDYLEEYADLTGADFVRNPKDVGIVADFDDLAGPDFDPSMAHPLIREFYEHTSRFRLSITPEWRWWMRPVYLAYRATIARPFGQANPPFDISDVQRGVVSYIDTIDLHHTGQVDFRAWVRAYETSNEPIYVGIYTVLRRDGIGYVSVGFPLPHGNFTATLMPYANRGDGLLLMSASEHPYPGHYLSAMEDGQPNLSTVELRNFGEEIDVFVDDGELRTDHRFLLNGIRFLTLHYEITRKDES